MPPSHGTHSDAPNAALIEPGVHGVGETDPVVHELPGGQGEHSDWAASLVALLKEPFSHGSGAEAPRAVESRRQSPQDETAPLHAAARRVGDRLGNTGKSQPTDFGLVLRTCKDRS